MSQDNDAAQRSAHVERGGTDSGLHPWAEDAIRTGVVRIGQAKEVAALRDALANLLNHYVALVNCGDCGFWSPEEEPVVKEARAALTAARKGEKA